MKKRTMTSAQRDEDSRTSIATSEPISTSVPNTSNYLPIMILSENAFLQLTTIRLNSKNFLQWSRTALIVIRGHGALGTSLELQKDLMKMI